jgi:AbrB family looped-hinge helix DNA binding protein
MITTVTPQGRVTIPKSIRDVVGMKPGDKVVVRVIAPGKIHIRPMKTATKGRPKSKRQEQT